MLAFQNIFLLGDGSKRSKTAFSLMILIGFVCLYIRTMIDYSITGSTSFHKIDQVFQQVSAEEVRLKEKATGCRNGIKPHKSGLSFQSSFSSVMGTEEQKKTFLG